MMARPPKDLAEAVERGQRFNARGGVPIAVPSRATNGQQREPRAVAGLTESRQTIGRSDPRARGGVQADDEQRADLPVIRITPRLHESVDVAVAALAADAEIYQRDGRLVRVVRVAKADAEREDMAAGTPQIRGVAIATLRERLTRAARFERFDARSGDWVETLPSDRIVTAVDARSEWLGIRPLVGVIETPSMRPDGTLLDHPGYDAATGYLYAPGREYPPLPARPTLDDARAALASLVEPFSDFPVSSEAERIVPIAALLTLVARPAIRGACPAFLFDASTRGSGKSLAARATTLLAHGREASLMSWPPDAVELEKVLGAYALRGAAVACFDNVTGEFGGGPLDKALTCADRVQLRVLGVSDVPELPWRAVILAGGNNMVIGGDTTRRVLVCRLEPMCELPEERSDYAIPDLMAWCREHHPRLVVAALTLLRAYVLAGRPAQQLAGWGSFEAWTALIASAIVWAGGPDIMACRPTIAGQDDATTGALRTLLEQLPGFAREGCSISTMLQRLYSPERMRGNAPPDGFESLREALEVLAPPRAGQAPSAQRLGTALGKLRRPVVAGRHLDRTITHGIARWHVVQSRGGAP
jgi:hypothetical protein